MARRKLKPGECKAVRTPSGTRTLCYVPEVGARFVPQGSASVAGLEGLDGTELGDVLQPRECARVTFETSRTICKTPNGRVRFVSAPIRGARLISQEELQERRAAEAAQKQARRRKRAEKRTRADQGPSKVIVTIPIPSTKGVTVERAWAKILTGIDPNQRGGYAYLGEFVPVGRAVEVPVGSRILYYLRVYAPSKQKAWAEDLPGKGEWTVITVYRATASGLEEEDSWALDAREGKSWALHVRDEIMKLLK